MSVITAVARRALGFLVSVRAFVENCTECDACRVPSALLLGEKADATGLRLDDTPALLLETAWPSEDDFGGAVQSAL